MTASAWPLPAPYKPLSGTNIAGRVVAVSIMAFGGLVLAAGAFGVSIEPIPPLPPELKALVGEKK